MNEFRFYLVNVYDTELDNVTLIPDEEFKALAHEQDLVFTMNDFVEAFNDYDFSGLNIDTQFLRILRV